MKTSKKDIYAAFGIEYKSGKIKSANYGYVNELLINGNAKIGAGVWHFSTLPTNNEFDVIVNGVQYSVRGTCVCNCVGCYATRGNYRYQSVTNSLGIRTLLIREELDFVERAIKAQIIADNIAAVRIHASGDFDNPEYLSMWLRVIENNPAVTFWTYTKIREYESAFDRLSNANIVKSIIPETGFNFGHCDYILDTFKKLKGNGKNVYICRCGIDKNQHCTNCRGCSKNEYVLFVEHSTDYKAEKDPAYSSLKAVIDSQPAVSI